MNKKQLVELGKYIRAVADQMGLRDWIFHILHTEPENPSEYDGTDQRAIADCEPTPGRRVAYLRFVSDFPQLGRDEIRSVVVHELMHCHFSVPQQHVRVGLMGNLSQPMYELFYATFMQGMEHSIDAVAVAWAEQMPLIQWGK